MTTDILPVGSRLYNGRQSVSLATGTSSTFDVEVAGTDWIVVQAKLAGGSADGDLGVTVAPYEDDNTTLTGFTIAPGPTAGPTNQSGTVRYYGQYDVIGIGRVRITVTNNNAGT